MTMRDNESQDNADRYNFCKCFRTFTPKWSVNWIPQFRWVSFRRTYEIWRTLWNLIIRLFFINNILIYSSSCTLLNQDLVKLNDLLKVFLNYFTIVWLKFLNQWKAICEQIWVVQKEKIISSAASFSTVLYLIVLHIIFTYT